MLLVPRGKPVDPDQRLLVVADLRRGYSAAETARRQGLNERTVRGIRDGLRNSSGEELKRVRREEEYSGPVPLGQLCVEAQRALNDIGVFALRYFGLILMPYQVESALQVVALLESPDEEYLVLNQPPGTGKSTFWTLVLPAWVTCRNRAVRGMLGSASQATAEWYTQRLRTAFTRRTPVKAKQRDIELGIAVDAVATLPGDFGRFRPLAGDDAWRADGFTVAQHGGVEISEKEPTWSAFGRSSTFIGARVDLAIWDDVYDPHKMRTAESRQELKDWWDEYAETRLEPGGLLILQGQRLSPDDIYRHALSKTAGFDDEDLDDELGAPVDGAAGDGESPAKYHHVRYRAHYEDRCRGRETHARGAAPYPEGCLLYPKRLGWPKLRAAMTNSASKFQIVYQQEEVDPEAVLVQKAWIDGGTDPDTGELFVGCLDHDRGLCELPRDPAGNVNLVGPLLSVVTADPSPTKFWAIEWWIVDAASGQRFLMDLLRQRMEAPDFLDRLFPSGEFVGVMEEWQQRSVKLGVPITHWVVEVNAAQRFMLQYRHVHDWIRQRGVSVVKHETGRNKSDPTMGIESIAPQYRFGRVRLPWAQRTGARVATLKLVAEVTLWPEARTDDCVMAHWFLEWNVDRLRRSLTPSDPEPQSRPAFVRELAGAR